MFFICFFTCYTFFLWPASCNSWLIVRLKPNYKLFSMIKIHSKNFICFLYSELTEHLPLFSPLFTLAIWSRRSRVLFVTEVMLDMWPSNISSSCSHFKASVLTLWLLAVLSQRAVSLQLRRLAGSPGRCVAGRLHPWLIPLPSAQQGYVIPAGIRTVEELLLPGCITASLPLFGWRQLILSMRSLCLAVELMSHHCEAVSKATATSLSTCHTVNESIHS